MAPFLKLAEAEVRRSRAKHEPCRKWHYYWGVLLEEVHEFGAEVMRKESKRKDDALLRELVQIAACALRAAEEMGLVAGEGNGAA